MPGRQITRACPAVPATAAPGARPGPTAPDGRSGFRAGPQDFPDHFPANRDVVSKLCSALDI